MSNIVVIYHHPCSDGFASMLVAKKFLNFHCPNKEVEYIQGNYSESISPETFKGKYIYLLDFSWKADYLKKVLEVAEKVVILDHHKTAKPEVEECKGYHNLDFVYDENKSGVGITHWYFYGESSMPKLFQHVQDRDLWRFNLENTKEVSLYLMSIGFDESSWNLALANYESTVEKGKMLLEYHNSICEDIASMATEVDLFNWKEKYGLIPLVQYCPGRMVSDVLHILAKGKPFSAAVLRKKDKLIYSLRASDESEVDVSEIAKSFGGGGHKKAAGFTICHNK